MVAQETLDDIRIRIKTYKNLIPAYRQRNADDKDKIETLKQGIRVDEEQIASMRRYLELHGEKENTIAEWAKEVSR